MSDHPSPFPERRSAVPRSPDPNDEQRFDSAHDTGHRLETGERDGETVSSPQRVAREDL
jgi:hypothetical protein